MSTFNQEAFHRRADEMWDTAVQYLGWHRGEAELITDGLRFTAWGDFHGQQRGYIFTISRSELRWTMEHFQVPIQEYLAHAAAGKPLPEFYGEHQAARRLAKRAVDRFAWECGKAALSL